MPYDEAFYRQYCDYLEEPSVREAHDWLFSLALANPAFRHVFDLGCGKAQEFRAYTNPTSYLGIDECNPEGHDYLIAANYRCIDWESPVTQHVFKSYRSFVSLFSSEITALHQTNTRLYERLFRSLPKLKVGLVSGFYYASRDWMQAIPVPETGEIVSYQSLEFPHLLTTDSYTVKQITLPVPSQMFGPDVWEVWRFLERTTA